MSIQFAFPGLRIPFRLPTSNFNSRKCPSQRRRGFTLLMSVVALAIGVLVLTSIARFSQSKAMLARQQLTELQWRWGNYSCQNVLLQNAENVLQVEQESHRLAPERELRFQLGNQSVFVRIADENQKLDVNTLAQRVPLVELERTIGNFNHSKLPIRLQPLSNTQRRTLKEGGLECWDQVWQLGQEPDIQQLIIGSRELTLWGNRVNISSSSEQTIRAFGQPFVGSIVVEKLLSARTLQGEESLSPLIAEANLNQRQSQNCHRLFCESSTSFSMWLTMVSGRRMRSSLTVREGIPVGDGGQVIGRVHAFRW